ncbi:MAG: hypothetical protein HY293_04750 [Planctomycetes bacterium]|nr:hypothetical protein [Planctomycetota bacterium]
MADPAPKKPAGPMKYLLVGCGVLTAVFLLGMGGCGAIFYGIYRGSDSTAEIGAAYLRSAPAVQEAFGDATIRRKWWGWNIQVVNDGGNAQFSYSILGSKEPRERAAVVWLVRSGGKWSALGARVDAKDGRSLTIGNPPAEQQRVKWDD